MHAIDYTRAIQNFHRTLYAGNRMIPSEAQGSGSMTSKRFGNQARQFRSFALCQRDMSDDRLALQAFDQV